jgi:hypothetical protein
MIFILGNLWIIYFSISRRPAPVVWGLVTIAAGMGMYVYFYRNRSHPREKTTRHPKAVRTLLSDRGEVGLNPSKPEEDLS